MVVGRHAAHVVVHGRDDRDRLLGHVDAGKDGGGLADARQALGEQLGRQVVEVQVDVVLLRPDAAALGLCRWFLLCFGCVVLLFGGGEWRR